MNEFHELKKQEYSLYGLSKENLIYFYESILNRTSEYSRNSKNIEHFNQHKKVLRHLLIATLSSIDTLKDNFYPNFITNISQTLDLLKQNIDDLMNLQGKNKKAGMINRFKENYKSAINNKLSEAETLISDQILPEINNIHIEIDNKIAMLIDETKTLQEEAKEEMEKLIERKRQLEKMFILGWIFNSLKFFGQIIGFFGTVGYGIGAATELGTGIGESVALSEDWTTTVKLPAGIVSDIKSIKNKIVKIKTYSDTPVNFFSNSYNKFTSDKKNIKTIDDAINQAKAKIKKLEQYEKRIHGIILPVLENMENDLDYIISQLNTKSKISLDVTKWQVQKALKDMKLEIRKFTKGFNVEENLAHCIENLEEVMVTLISVYDSMQDYQYQKDLANFIAEINYPNNNNVDIQDVELRKAADELDIVTKSSFVLRQHKIAVDALKQHSFPFASLYLEEPIIPYYLDSEDNFQNLVNKATEQIETMQSKIKQYETSISQLDNYLSSGLFNSDYESTKPFFVWKNERYNNAISKLLSGKKVVVKSHILNSHPDKDAIKFNTIGLNFHSSNSSISSEVRNKMRKFIVNLTHLGNSYYRFNNDIFMIASSSQNIRFSYEKDNFGDPVHKNNVYAKLKSGDSIVSPYAMWEIQLINPEGEIPFELEMYKDVIDVELIGRGCYLTKGYNISNLDIEKYYKANKI